MCSWWISFLELFQATSSVVQPTDTECAQISTLLAGLYHELRTTGLGLTAISRESPGICLSVILCRYRAGLSV